MLFSSCKYVFTPLSAILLFAVTALANQEQQYQESVAEIARKIGVLTEKINVSRSLLKSERDRLSRVERQIVELDRQLIETGRALQREIKLGETMDREISVLEKAHVKDKVEISNLVRQRYMQGTSNYVKMLLNQENPYAVGRLNNYLEYFTKAHLQKIQALRKQIAEFQELKSKRQTNMVKLEEIYRTQKAHQKDLTVAKQARLESIAKLDKKVLTNEEELNQLNRDRDRLNRLLTQLAEQAEKLRKLEQQRLAKQARKKNAGKQKNNKSLTSMSLVRGGFTKHRGQLKYPVTGSVRYGFGSQIRQTGMRSQGTFFTTNGPQEVSTIFRGRVLFSDYLKGYGLMMIIDHGDEHISLYGHNEVLYKEVGEMVTTGEVVAKSGVSGGLKSHGLYFEIRKSATPVDPSIWCN